MPKLTQKSGNLLKLLESQVLKFDRAKGWLRVMSTDFRPKMTLKASTERNQIPLYFIMRVVHSRRAFPMTISIYMTHYHIPSDRKTLSDKKKPFCGKSFRQKTGEDKPDALMINE